jgi:hypothetical protein
MEPADEAPAFEVESTELQGETAEEEQLLEEELQNVPEPAAQPSSLAPGWSAEYTEEFLSLSNDRDRLALVKKIMGIGDEDYNVQETATFIVDFHLANAVFCQEAQFNVVQTRFVCRALSRLLREAVDASADTNIDYDKLRLDLVSSFRTQFKRFNADQKYFTLDRMDLILRYTLQTFLRPLRLILRQFQQKPYFLQVLEFRKVFAPPPCTPLCEFEESVIVRGEDEEFFRPAIGKIEDMTQFRQRMEQHCEAVEEIANKRLEKLEERVQKVLGAIK